MKSKVIITLLIFVSLGVSGIERSKITEVIVYQRGAKITRKAVTNVKPGNNEIILGDITTSINGSSLQVKVVGEAVLLSAASRLVTLEDEQLPEKTRLLEDSIFRMDKRIRWLNSQKAVYQGEENIIYTNQKLGTDEEKITVEELIQLSKFYRERLLDIKQRMYEIDTEIDHINRTKNKINTKLNELRYSEKKTKSEIVISLSSKKTTSVTLYISYLTHLASWAPIYDVRAEGADKPLTLIYKANLIQTTGYDWDNVQLTISTGNPSANNNRPIMHPWYISFVSNQVYNTRDVYRRRAASGEGAPAQEMMQSNIYIDEMTTEESKEESFIDYNVTETTNRMAAEYKIDARQDIPSDGKEHLVAMQEYGLDAGYSYHAVPKLDKAAYMLAKIADYGKYNLLPGYSNLFFEGMYIGQSYLNPVTTVDSMLLSLGQDDKITVKRNRLQDIASKQVIGGNVKEKKGFEIVIRNNHSFEISIDVLDQIPISQNKEIEVVLEDAGSARYNKDYGSILWKMKIRPGETKKVRFVYSIKYPKGQTVYGL